MPKLLLILCCWGLLLLADTPVCSGAPFDLDLQEFSKPFVPRSETSKKKPAVTAKTAATTHRKRIKPPKAASTQKPVPVPPEEATASLPAELSLKADDTCRLAENMAIALAPAVPAESLLNGLDLHPVAGVRAGDGGLLITCGLSVAEAYTYQRLLEEHGVRLLNVGATDSAGKIAQELMGYLGLSCSQEAVGPATGGELIYLCPATGEQHQRPLRLIIQP